jgi:hypothetical protein
MSVKHQNNIQTKVNCSSYNGFGGNTRLFFFYIYNNAFFYQEITPTYYCKEEKNKQYLFRLTAQKTMSTSTEPKPLTNEEDDSETTYSVEEDDESETDQFSRMKPHLIRTPSILNAIIDQIHPDIIAKFVK